MFFVLIASIILITVLASTSLYTWLCICPPKIPSPSLSSRSYSSEVDHAWKRRVLFLPHNLFLLVFPAIIPFARDHPRKRWPTTSGTDASRFIQVLACRFFPYAFVPCAARYASSASPYRHSGDIGTGVPCHIPISDDFSNCSSTCRPCRRPNSWSLPGWMNQNLTPCPGLHRTATWSRARSIVAKLLPIWDRWCWGPRLEHKVPGFISMCPAQMYD